MVKFSIALAQLAPVLFEKEHNLAKAEDAIREASKQGASAILFPELYLTGYSLGDRAMELAEARDGNSVRRIIRLAKDYRIAVLMGFAELSEDRQHAYDALLISDAMGNIVDIYCKTHLFHAENKWFLPGNQFLIIDFGCGPTGVLICYDLEFPESARQLALRGAQWIAISTGNMVPNQHLQEVYIQSRAAENRLWVAVTNRIGKEGSLDFFGGSAVADPSGEITASAGTEETIIYADIDLDRSSQARLNADYLSDRRADLYTLDS